MIPITLSSNILVDLLAKIFVLSGISLVLLFLLRFLKLGSSDTRAKVFLVLLLLPISLFLLYIAFIDKLSLADCGIFSLCQTALHIPSQLFGSLQSINVVNLGLVALSVLVVFVGTKQLMGFLLGRRFVRKFEIVTSESYEEAHRILKKMLEKAQVMHAVDLDIGRLNHPVALTTGLLRPRILISSWFIDSLDREELEAVIAHEVAHIKRRDNFINSLAALAKDILFFLPSSYPAWHSYLREREKACDDLTVSITERPLALASALLKVGKVRAQNGLVARIADPSSLSLSRANSTLQERVKRLTSHSGSTKRNSIANYLFTLTMSFLILGMTSMPALSWQQPAKTPGPNYCCSSMQDTVCPDTKCSR